MNIFYRKICYLVGKTWKPYITTILAALVINFSFKASVYNPLEVFYAILALGALFLVIIFILYIKKLGKINTIRDSKGLQKIGLMQVELNPSFIALDMAFLIFSSWKTGEAIVKIPKLISETITESQLIFVFSALTLTITAVLYSFIKAFDKVKEYKGVNSSDPTADTNTQGLSGFELFWSSFWDFFIALVILVISPAIIGFTVAFFVN